MDKLLKDFRSMPTHLIKPNPDNPRVIKDHQYRKLRQSILDDPYMECQREIIVDEDFMILGGNMRLKVFQELGYRAILVSVFSLKIYEEYKKKFPKSKVPSYTQACRNIVVLDNKSFGEYDFEIMANLWSEEAKAYEISFEHDDNAFSPELYPETNYNDVTKEEIQEQAKILAKQMIKERKDEDVICPKCGNEFSYQR